MRKLLIFLSIGWLSLPGFGQQTAYEYPITPKSPQWAELKDYSQKREVCQLPGDVLKSLSTPQLVEAILDYPLLMDLFVFRNLQTGFDNLKKKL